jgi:hypothetical protein
VLLLDCFLALILNWGRVGFVGMCSVEPLGLPCLELEADEPEHAEAPIEAQAAAAINDEEVGEDTGGLVTGSPPGQNPLSPLSSEEEWSLRQLDFSTTMDLKSKCEMDLLFYKQIK